MKQIILAISLLLLLSILGCGKSPGTLEKISVTLDWTPNTNHTGLYVAQELGYFTEAGLDVEILQPGQSITDQIVATGKSQFGVSYQENVIRARSEGIPLISIAAVIQHNTSGFASLKEAGITSVKDFEGKRYGSWDSPSELAILSNVMQAANADVNKVKVISGIYDFFSTIGKDADFEWIYYGWDGVIAAQRGVEINYIPLKDLNPVFDYYTPVLISSEDYLKDNPDTARKFLSAVKKGYEYCILYPDKAADILLKHVPELNNQQVQASVQYLCAQYQAEAAYWGLQEPEVWQSFANWMSDEKLISAPLNIDQAYTNEYLLP
ncbi:MAG: ABC transporter substrate-binding protein [Candidatus Cloacimonetes bacterium]|jgi:ABC-type nitrate/sulfonate/bicarbonate transport system substrate-binding protein|nr:ABC transporter substrate-binding protein [Candidatus Cloacimonadota bacterium]MCB5287749.1 ABC transporter substrate-binding protein [Candidatus Cloacimonadota bacterium]MCK9184822.1 ABC transporter substrate-binding protein [Candidatus Cloacimonadota bacterium]MCK9585063.1 ABC transporter substrate-binding protein [Candidatus Cloacimonadota bacterium]MDY0230070.1 ABC transporter substrate-binding protein [Candidatus Cloacimonadaceae bacterium]